ncbi:MAG: tyrosine-type recombinase/integrase [Elusimicrobia bacterium]|nr:tyrosine-type recombinase/integrase [Elusimicrobiota bacterium]
MTLRNHRLADRSISFEHAQEAFFLRCKAKGLSPLTEGWYKGILTPLSRFLAGQGISSPKDATPHLLRAHLDTLRTNGSCSGTIFRTYGGIRCFFGFLSRERMIPANPMQLIEKPRKEHKLIPALTLEQARLLLAQPRNDTYRGVRAWTMMVLVLDTGLRLAEVLGLLKDNVDFQRNVLRIIGKGNKEREVPFGTATKQALWQYAARIGSLEGQQLFFVNQFGRKLHRRWFQEQMRVYGKKAGIQGVRVSPHTLRHTFATQYILNGGDAFSLQKILGHSSLDMVRVYVDLANRDVALQHRRFSPIDRMGVVPGASRSVLYR